MNALLRKMLHCLAALLLVATAMSSADARAQDAGTPVRAVVGVVPPLVMQDGGKLTGFSIDLWDAIAARLKLQTSYMTAPDVAGAIEAMRSGKADVIAVPSFYTTERDREFDFSFSVLNAGLLVMVPDTGGTVSANPLLDLAHLIFSPRMLLWLGVGLILILIPAHLFWLLDRNSEESICPDKRYFPGIFHALIWAATALVSQVQQLPGQRIARALAVVWMFVGVVFIAFYTAQLTADLTVEQFRGLINGPGDLPGKKVATLAGTEAATYLKQIGADVQEYPTVERMFAALSAKQADAVVQAAPLLRYYAAHEGLGKVRTVGDEFHKQDAGYVVQLNSPLRRRINAALIALHEEGTYDDLYNKWFGGS